MQLVATKTFDGYTPYVTAADVAGEPVADGVYVVVASADLPGGWSLSVRSGIRYVDETGTTTVSNDGDTVTASVPTGSVSATARVQSRPTIVNSSSPYGWLVTSDYVAPKTVMLYKITTAGDGGSSDGGSSFSSLLLGGM